MRKTKRTKPYPELMVIHTGILLLVLIGFFSLFFYAGKQNRVEKNLSFDWNIDSVENEDIYATLSCKTGWSKGGLKGNEYEGLLVNKTGHAIMDWKLSVNLDEEVDIESGWNGVWVNGTDKLYYYPNSINMQVEDAGERKFGVILYTHDSPELSEITLKYRTNIRPAEYPLFWVLLAFGILDIFSMAALTIANVRIKSYESKHTAYKTLVNESLRTIANIIDTKDEYTKGHSLRVAIYSRQLAKRMGLPDYEQERIYYIGLLHDIGKIGIPSSILTKPSKLTDEEYEIIKRHPLLGFNIMKDFSSIKGAQEGIRYHHERYDGKGYNDGLKGEEIPLEGRIICVADSYDAMSSRRCYRDSLSYDYILDELKKNSGVQFDPNIVCHMIDMIEGGYAPVSDAEMRDYKI